MTVIFEDPGQPNEEFARPADRARLERAAAALECITTSATGSRSSWCPRRWDTERHLPARSCRASSSTAPACRKAALLASVPGWSSTTNEVAPGMALFTQLVALPG